MFKSVILAGFLMLTSLAANAESCSDAISRISNLSTTEKQEMIVKCEQNKLNKVDSKPNEVKESTQTIDMFDKWSDISLKFAKAIGVAANEMNIAVNQFITTPAGILTVSILILKIFDPFNFLIGIGLLIGINSLRKVITDGILFEDTGVKITKTYLFGLFKKEVPRIFRRNNLDGEQIFGVVVCLLAQVILSIIVIVNLI